MTAIDYDALTPREVDTFLAENWMEQARANQAFDWKYDALRRAAGQKQNRDGFWEGGSAEDAYAFVARQDPEAYIPVIGAYGTYGKVITEYLDARAVLEDLRTAARPYEAQYDERRWNRYFIVQNSNGHVHREMHCSTCYVTTRFSWLPELSGCSEPHMVSEWGEVACTVCFPDAPTYSGYGDGTSAFARLTELEKAAKAAEKAAKQAAKQAKLLEPELQFGELAHDTWMVTTVAAAKQQMRDAWVAFNGFGYDREREDAQRVLNAAERALTAKGMTIPEIDDLKAKALKRAQKRGY
jgi:hypothetical protein